MLRITASGLGITYEALTGDLSNVNFSSGRMGRMEMDRNVSAWQWLLLIPQMMQPLSAWTLEAWPLASSRARPASLAWVPPARIVVDPAKEYAAMVTLIRAGLTSRSASIQALGYDAETVEAEIAADNARADAAGLIFDSDPRRTGAAGTAQQPPDTSTEEAPDGRE